MTKLQDAINQIQVEARAMAGVKAAPDGEDLPESMGVFPFVVTYPRSGQENFPSDGWVKTLHTVFTEFHVGRAHLPGAMNLAVPLEEVFVDRVRKNVTLTSKADSIVSPILYTFGRLDWGTNRDVHIGYRFEITFKIERSVT